MTYHGRVGQQFHVASDYAVNILTSGDLKEEPSHRFQQHTYQVTDRIQNGDIVLVRAEYRQKEGPRDHWAAAAASFIIEGVKHPLLTCCLLLLAAGCDPDRSDLGRLQGGLGTAAGSATGNCRSPARWPSTATTTSTSST